MILQVDFHMSTTRPQVGIDAHASDVDVARMCLQLNSPHDTVPVTLRLVGHGVGVLPHPDMLRAVIHADSNLVLASGMQVFRHIVDMRRRERHLVAHLVAVHVDGGLDVGTLQEQHDALAFPFARHIHLALVPCRPHIVAFGRQEEGKLHLALGSVFGHVGIEVERRVVERACPLRVNPHGITLSVGQHRAWQHHVVVVVWRLANTELPRTGKREHLLCPCRQGNIEY